MNLLKSIENLFKRAKLPGHESQPEISQLRNEIARLTRLHKESEKQVTTRTLEKLIGEAASPLSQLILQDLIASTGGQDLTAQDVLLNVKKLVAVLEGAGMSVIGQPAEMTAFDSQFHESARPDFLPVKGQRVCIRYPGIAFNSTVLQKAAVVPPEDAR